MRQAGARDASILTDTRVLSVEVIHQRGAERVRVETDGGSLIADTVVIAAGGWLPHLAERVGVRLDLPALRVTQQQVFHFTQRDPAAQWPVFVHKHKLAVFGLPSGRDAGPGAMKVAQHDGGAVTTAQDRSGVVDPAGRECIIDYVTTWLPGLNQQPVAETTCLYTITPNEDFILDRVGPVVVVSPCSGHGAKFAPLIGDLAAELAVGESKPQPRFALRAHLVPS